MHEATLALRDWESFYVIVGSSAAVLIGLMFVVITLMATSRRGSTRQGVDTFSTPSVAHLCAALLMAAILSAPWHKLWHAGLLLALTGLAGLTYAAIVVRRMRGMVGYQPEREDWLWYVVLPLATYTALVVAALVLPGRPTPALFVIGAVAMLLLFIGIHNAWDIVTFIVVEGAGLQDERED